MRLYAINAPLWSLPYLSGAQTPAALDDLWQWLVRTLGSDRGRVLHLGLPACESLEITCNDDVNRAQTVCLKRAEQWITAGRPGGRRRWGDRESAARSYRVDRGRDRTVGAVCIYRDSLQGLRRADGNGAGVLGRGRGGRSSIGCVVDDCAGGGIGDADRLRRAVSPGGGGEGGSSGCRRSPDCIRPRNQGARRVTPDIPRHSVERLRRR